MPDRLAHRRGIIDRVVGDKLDPHRLDNLFVVGVDEVSWRRGQQYLTLVCDHQSRSIVWGAAGRDAATLGGFYDELGPGRAGRLEAVSMDMSAAFAKSTTGHAPQAVICYDPFHVVALATKALDAVRRAHWQELRRADPEAARRFKGARWCLLKNPTDLSEDQAATAAQDAPPRRGDLAGLHPQGGAARHLRRRPEPRRGRHPAGPVLLQGLPQRTQTVPHPRPHHPRPTSRVPGRRRPRREQRPPTDASG